MAKLMNLKQGKIVELICSQHQNTMNRRRVIYTYIKKKGFWRILCLLYFLFFFPLISLKIITLTHDAAAIIELLERKEEKSYPYKLLLETCSVLTDVKAGQLSLFYCLYEKGLVSLGRRLIAFCASECGEITLQQIFFLFFFPSLVITQ